MLSWLLLLLQQKCKVLNAVVLPSLKHVIVLLLHLVFLVNQLYYLKELSFHNQREMVTMQSFLLSLLVLKLKLELKTLWFLINILLLIKLKLVKLKVVVKNQLKMLKLRKELSIFVVKLLLLKNIMTHLKENIAPVKKEKELLKADQELKLKIMSMLEPLYQTLHQVQSLAHAIHAVEH